VRALTIKETLNIGCGGTRQYPFNDLGCTVNCDVQKPTYRISNFVICDACTLPFRNNAFSSVYAYHIIEHLQKLDKFLQECARITEGKIHIVTPNLYSKNSLRDPSHIQHFSRTTLEMLLRKHFSKVEVKGMNETWVHIIESRFTFRISKLIASKLPFMAENLYALCNSNTPERAADYLKRMEGYTKMSLVSFVKIAPATNVEYAFFRR